MQPTRKPRSSNSPADPLAAALGSQDGDPMTARLPTLRASLSERADRAGLLDIAYRTLETPIGSLLLAATGAGLLRVAFATEDHDRVLDQLARRVSPRLLTAPRRLDRAAREIDEYFAQRRRRFALRLDLQLAHGFRREVLDHLALVPYGATVSYGGLAAAAGSPRAVRAAGSACATNPLPIVVPCHRVLRSDGSLGRYGGGAHVKRALLLLEGAQAPTMG